MPEPITHPEWIPMSDWTIGFWSPVLVGGHRLEDTDSVTFWDEFVIIGCAMRKYSPHYLCRSISTGRTVWRFREDLETNVPPPNRS